MVLVPRKFFEKVNNLRVLGLDAALELGQADFALKAYSHLTPPSSPDNQSRLRKIAMTFLTSGTRDPSEFIRISAFSMLGRLEGRLNVLFEGRYLK